MKVSTERMPESQVLMTIEVEAERLDAAREKALRKLSPRAKVPGFRPGKAPKNLIRQYFGEERILDEALDALVPDLYREAVEADESIIPIARPRLVVETTEPLVVKATIPVRPTIELGDYASVRVEPEEVTVDESRVDETLLTLRRRSATLEPIERPVNWRDVIRIDVSATVDGEPLVEQQEAEVQLVEERDVLFPGFEAAVIGSAKGEEVEFDLDVPEDLQNPKFAGKTAHFKVRFIETKEEVLPEEDEEFAKAVGEGFDTVDALRERVRGDIQRYEEDQLVNRYQDEVLTKLVEQATIEFPPVMLESEIERMVHDQAGHVERGQGLERYLAAIGKTEEEVRDEFRPVADARIRRSLVLGQVAEAENIEVTPEEIQAEVIRLAASAGPQAAQFMSLFGSEEGRSTIRRNLLTRKTLDRLVNIATEGRYPVEREEPVTAGDAAQLAAEVEAASADAEGEAPDVDGAEEEETEAGTAEDEREQA